MRSMQARSGVCCPFNADVSQGRVVGHFFYWLPLCAEWPIAPRGRRRRLHEAQRLHGDGGVVHRWWEDVDGGCEASAWVPVGGALGCGFEGVDCGGEKGGAPGGGGVGRVGGLRSWMRGRSRSRTPPCPRYSCGQGRGIQCADKG